MMDAIHNYHLFMRMMTSITNNRRTVKFKNEKYEIDPQIWYLGLKWKLFLQVYTIIACASIIVPLSFFTVTFRFRLLLGIIVLLITLLVYGLIRMRFPKNLFAYLKRI